MCIRDRRKRQLNNEISQQEISSIRSSMTPDDDTTPLLPHQKFNNNNNISKDNVLKLNSKIDEYINSTNSIDDTINLNHSPVSKHAEFKRLSRPIRDSQVINNIQLQLSNLTIQNEKLSIENETLKQTIIELQLHAKADPVKEKQFIKPSYVNPKRLAKYIDSQGFIPLDLSLIHI